MHSYPAKVGENIMRNTGANKIWSRLPVNATRWSGGTRMGSDPKTSVVNGYCQSHDIPNLFVVGASVLPTLMGLPGHGYDLRAFLPYGGIHHAPA